MAILNSPLVWPPINQSVPTMVPPQPLCKENFEFKWAKNRFLAKKMSVGRKNGKNERFLQSVVNKRLIWVGLWLTTQAILICVISCGDLRHFMRWFASFQAARNVRSHPRSYCLTPSDIIADRHLDHKWRPLEPSAPFEGMLNGGMTPLWWLLFSLKRRKK